MGATRQRPTLTSAEDRVRVITRRPIPESAPRRAERLSCREATSASAPSGSWVACHVLPSQTAHECRHQVLHTVRGWRFGQLPCPRRWHRNVRVRSRRSADTARHLRCLSTVMTLNRETGVQLDYGPEVGLPGEPLLLW